MEASISVGSMLQMWRDFNLSSLQSDLDLMASQVAERQDESVVSRKKLVTESKAFNKSMPDDVKKIVNPLIKLFQGEIDKLSKRSKAAETAFLSSYKRILEVPDPVPALDVGDILQRQIQRQHDAETENAKLRDTIEQYKKDFADKKQQERELASLKSKVEELEEDLEKESNERAIKKEKELSTKFAEKEATLQETQMLVAGKLETVEQRAAELQQQNETARQELFKVRQDTEELLSSKQTELDMLNNDLERLNSRVQADTEEIKELRNENVSLSKKNSSGGDGDDEDDNGSGMIDANVSELRTANSGLERDLREKERELGQMVADMSHLQESLKISREHHNTDKSRFETLLTDKSKNADDLESKLHRWRDYDEIKRELTVLKSVEFPEPCESEKAKSLEVLLLEKNRGLQTENSQLRLQQSDLAERYEQTQTNQTEQRIQIENQENLIRQLEADLLSINHTHRDVMKLIKRPPAEGAHSVVGSEITNMTGYTSGTQKYHSPFVPVQSNSMSTELISDAIKGMSPNDSFTEIAPVSNQNSVDSSLLAIVSSQRERFRVRVQELEEHSHLQQQQLQLLHNDMDQLRTDNVKLYEKIKFLQSYNGSGKRSTAIGIGAASNEFDEMASRKYAGEYEKQLDPFAKFSQRERARKYMNLSPHDKVTLSMGRIILGSKTARTIAFFYTILIHCLLYLILYKFANTEDCKRHIGDHITLEMCEKAFGQHQGLR